MIAVRREALTAAINLFDGIGDWAALVEAASHHVCERLCARLDLIPTGVRERHHLTKES